MAMIFFKSRWTPRATVHNTLELSGMGFKMSDNLREIFERTGGAKSEGTEYMVASLDHLRGHEDDKGGEQVYFDWIRDELDNGDKAMYDRRRVAEINNTENEDGRYYISPTKMIDQELEDEENHNLEGEHKDEPGTETVSAKIVDAATQEEKE